MSRPFRSGPVLGTIAVAVTVGVAVLSIAPPAEAAPAPWTTVPSPDIGVPLANGLLSAVSCSGATACVAVGGYFDGNVSESGAAQTLTESWNGSTWTVDGALDASTQDNELSAVSCTASNFCAAVGYYIDAGGNEDTLVETWNGSSWSIVPSPNASTQNSLQGVSCTSATLCTAVGNYVSAGTNSDGLIERWNGSVWTIVPSPSPSPHVNTLSGVSCRGPRFCAAVGSLVEMWNGSTWTVATAPLGAVGVSCRTRSACMAVGSFGVGGNTRTSTESWNGSTWTVVPSPNASPVQNGLASVSCRGGASCVAVGSSTNGGSTQTLIESWNGSSWTVVPSPDASLQTNQLLGVSCVTRADCLAVGSYRDVTYFNGAVPRTLVEVSIGHSHRSTSRT